MSHPLLKKAAIAAGAILAVWLGSRYLLPIALPFALAALVALVADPLVRTLERRLHLPRWLGAGLGVGVTLLLGILILVTLCALLIRELGNLAGVMPDLEETALEGMDALEGFLLDMAGKTPKGISPILTRSVENLFSDGSALLDEATDRVLRMASGVMTRIPDSALGMGTWLLASFMISTRLPKLRCALRERIPQAWREHTLPALKRMRQYLSRWAMAQLKLAGLTFLVLSVCFLLLRIPHGILWAGVICLLDALPVLGTATILVPWSLVSLLQGDHIRAIGLLGTYTAVWALRSALEPRMVGKQLGLDPLWTLLAMYAGYRIWGLAGMIAAPLLAVLLYQFLAFSGKPEEK